MINYFCQAGIENKCPQNSTFEACYAFFPFISGDSGDSVISA